MNSGSIVQDTLSCSPPWPTQAQTVLSEQLAALIAQALEVAERLNALSLPARLPPEILSEVFLTHTARVQKEHLDGVLSHCGHATKVPSYFKWIYVTQVCRRWREVALACTEFRAFLVFEGYSMPKHNLLYDGMLPQGFPLSIVYHQNVDDRCSRCTTWYSHSIGTDFLAKNLSYIRHLTIIIETDNGTRELWDSLDLVGSSLETLRIGLRGEAWHYHTREFASKLTVPNGLFEGSTPRLRSLTTSYVSFSWTNTLLCPSLRHLEITAHPGHRPDMDMAKFIWTLATLPLLETLVIDRLPSIAEQTLDTITHLPRLRLVQTSATVEAATFLLAHLRFPPSTSVALTLENPALETPQPASQALARELSRISQDAPIHAMSWRISPLCILLPGDTSCLRAWAETVASPDKLWVSKPDIPPRLTLFVQDAYDIRTLLDALPLGQLKALHIQGPMPPCGHWVQACGSAADLSLLRLTGRAGYQLGTTLSRTVASTEDRGCAEMVVLPGLRALELFEVRFPPPSRADASTTDEEGYICDDCEPDDAPRRVKRGMDVKDLVRGLRRRRALGARDVDRVEFRGCEHMKMSHLQPLLREGPAVVVDGITLGIPGL